MAPPYLQSAYSPLKRHQETRSYHLGVTAALIRAAFCSDRHSNTIKTGHSRPHALRECYGHSRIYLYILWLNRHYAQEGAAGVSLHQVRGPPRSIPSP